jgi:hypothetical protein
LFLLLITRSDLLQLCLDYLSAYPLLVGACLCVPIFLLVAFLLIMRSDEDEPKARKTKKKKKEEQKEKRESKKDK